MIPVPHTGLAQGLVLVASDKVLADLISSMCQWKHLTWAYLNPVNTIGSRRVGFSGGYNVPLAANPFSGEIKVLDCGDIPVTSYVIFFFLLPLFLIFFL